MMSIALRRSDSNSVRLSNFMQCVSIYESAEAKGGMDERRCPGEGEREREEDLKSASSSSIGKNSDVSPDAEEANEVQSSFGGSLGRLDALEDAPPPVRRGISRFYSGKSKSFTSLADASSLLSIKNLEKPENPYNRKRKNLIPGSNLWDKKDNHHFDGDGSGMSKKAANFGTNTFFIEVTVNSPEMMTDEDSNSIPSSFRHLPPLHPQVKRSAAKVSSSSPSQLNSSWRSFSMSDLQSFAASGPNVTGLAIHGGDMESK